MLERSRRVILLIDFDNLQICASRDTPGRDLQLEPVVQLAQRYGTVVTARAYAEWNLSTERLAVYKAGIEPAFAPVLRTESDRSGKSLADTVMVAEGMDMLWTLSPDVMILATSDKDLIPLVRVARQRGTRVVVLGSDFTAIPLRDMADEHVTYKQLITDGTGRYVDGPSVRTAGQSDTGRRNRVVHEREPREAREPREPRHVVATPPAATAPSPTPALTSAGTPPAPLGSSTEPVAPVSVSFDPDGPLGGRRRRRRGSRRRSDRIGGTDDDNGSGAADQDDAAAADGQDPSGDIVAPTLPGLADATPAAASTIADDAPAMASPDPSTAGVFEASSETSEAGGQRPYQEEKAPAPLAAEAPLSGEPSLAAEPDASATDGTPAGPDGGSDAAPVKRPRARRVASASRGRSRPMAD